MVVDKLSSRAVGALLLMTLHAPVVFAHGYLSDPESRAYLCKLGENSDCGAVQWEPQSLEASDRYPEGGPADGQLASAGISLFSEMDEQSSQRWTKHKIEGSDLDISWQFTANHRTRDWRYFITRAGWDQDASLSRSSFETEPFCRVDGHSMIPEKEVTHRCDLPADREGYHVILAVWDIGDTENSFYNVMDVDIQGDSSATSSWKDIGDINPSVDLETGDRVSARFFGSQGELTNFNTAIQIGSSSEGARDNWPRELSRAINSAEGDFKAGREDSQGDISPVSGKNDVFVPTSSNVQRIEVEIAQATRSDEGSTDSDSDSGTDTESVDDGNDSVETGSEDSESAGAGSDGEQRNGGVGSFDGLFGVLVIGLLALRRVFFRAEQIQLTGARP